MIELHDFAPSGRIPRHEHRVRTFSRDYDLIAGFGDSYAVEAADAKHLVRLVVGRYGVPMPELAFNRRRRPDTGQCRAPKFHIESTYGADAVQAWERRKGRPYPEDGQIRLGAVTRLRTLAHELGHHLVHHLEPVRTPAHGKVWVGRFDDAMAIIAKSVSVCLSSKPGEDLSPQRTE